jgi:hypothetical protein
MKINSIKIVFLFTGFLLCNSLFAANNPPPPLPPPPPSAPIDGAIWLLLLASLILGFYKIYLFKKASR